MIRNKIKSFVDGLGISRYEFHKRAGIAKSTAYALYADSTVIPDEETERRVVRAFNCKSKDILEIVEIEK